MQKRTRLVIETKYKHTSEKDKLPTSDYHEKDFVKTKSLHIITRHSKPELPKGRRPKLIFEK